MVSQFTFEREPLIRWLESARQHVRPRGNGLPVIFFVGIAGPTPREKLLRVAALCGVGLGPSAAAFEMGPSTEGDLQACADTGLVWPTELVLALAEYCELNSVPEGEVRLHVYPFGGLDSAQQLASGLMSGSWPAQLK